jgi:thiamine biosynthesis protein ThiS
MSQITIHLNGEPREIASGLTLEGLLEALALDPRKLAVERNLEIAPRGQYAQIAIAEGDRLEIVHFVGGG